VPLQLLYFDFGVVKAMKKIMPILGRIIVPIQLVTTFSQQAPSMMINNPINPPSQANCDLLFLWEIPKL